MSATAVPKPANAGVGQAAVVNTRLSFANVRRGPGTNYQEVGIIRDKSLVTYYPASRQGDWLWVEQLNIAGWISTTVATFNHVNVEPPKDFPPTPYDGKVSIWHWKGQAIPETTIAQFVANLKKNAPNVKGVFVKIGDGSAWQGRFDEGDMAVNGPADVARWVRVLEDNGMEFHGWIVLKGRDIDGEADIVVKTSNVAGVKSVILDVEPYSQYWEVGPEPIAPLMQKMRAGVPQGFHIGLCIDPRQAHYKSVFPEEWYPYVDSVHTMSYWRTFRRTVENTLEETYRVWGGYGKPIIPVLQADQATVQEQRDAVILSTTQYGARGVSWWRYGVVAQWDIINTPLSVGGVTPPSQPGDTPLPPNTSIGKELVIFNGQTGFRSGTYTGQQEFVSVQGSYGWNYAYTATQSQRSRVWAEWATQLPEDGIYQISVFIPSRHATTRRARYKIHGIRGTNTEVVVDINQSIYRNEWVSLGVFDLVKNQQNAGKIFLNDVTGETGQEIAFDAVRYRQIVKVDAGSPPADGGGVVIPPGVFISDGYDAPVGTADERAGGISTTNWSNWFGQWRDATGFGRNTVAAYITGSNAYHTGVDLNWRWGNEDIGMPVYSPANGVVIFQAELNVWGNVTVVRHDPLFRVDGPVYYSRHAHMQNVRVKVGDRVQRGTQLGEIGTANGRFIAHLHYDIVRTTILETNPGDWPGMSITRVERDYVDPKSFTINHRPKR